VFKVDILVKETQRFRSPCCIKNWMLEFSTVVESGVTLDLSLRKRDIRARIAHARPANTGTFTALFVSHEL